MERPTNGEHLSYSPHAEDVLDLVTHQVDQAICTALDSLTQILCSPESSSPMSATFCTPAHSLPPIVSIRCRSSSRNDRRERKVAFHHTMPRCSLPATKTDHVQSHARSVSFQPAANPTQCQSSQNVNGHSSNRSFDVQYSFSLNRSWQTKIDKQRHQFLGVQNFVNELVEHSIHTALVQIDYQNLSNDTSSICTDDASCLLFDCSPSYAPVERLQVITAFADQLVDSTIEQSIEEITCIGADPVDCLAARFTEKILRDALNRITDGEEYSQTLLTDDEKHSRQTKRKAMPSRRLISNENHETQPTLFHQIRHRSSSAFRSLTNNHHQSQRDNVDSMVNNIAQKIYSDSFDELRRYDRR
jgi:hypothetical protein